jgi:hypothetical protein
MDRRPLNAEKPGRVPVGRMGDIPVIARFVFEDGEEWRPVSANRWTSTHVMVTWVEEGPNRDQAVWLRAGDVVRVLRKADGPA